MSNNNSHVARIVHPPDWPHAATVRHYAPTFAHAAVLSFRLFTDLTLRRHARICRRCDRDRVVWAPAGYSPRPCDFGACPRCDVWSAPYSISLTSGIDAGLIRLGETVAWHELSDRSLLEVARLLAWWFISPPSNKMAATIRPTLRRHVKRDLSFALTEAAYRNLLPKPDDLRIAWDLALAEGRALPGDDERLTLADVWALYWYPYRERIGAT